MRDCEDLIDSLVYYIRGTIADYKPDDKVRPGGYPPSPPPLPPPAPWCGPQPPPPPPSPPPVSPPAQWCGPEPSPFRWDRSD